MFTFARFETPIENVEEARKSETEKMCQCTARNHFSIPNSSLDAHSKQHAKRADYFDFLLISFLIIFEMNKFLLKRA